MKILERILIMILSATMTCIPAEEWKRQYESDLERLTTESYDTVFFSMYPTEHYNEADYAHFRAMEVVKTQLPIPDEEILVTYMDAALYSENEVTTVYLGIKPDKITSQAVANLLEEHPDTLFEIVPSYPNINYWLSLEDAEYTTTLQAYRDFVADIISYENARIQLFSGAQWLICNPGNYTAIFNTNVETSQLLMANTDGSHAYVLTADTMNERFAEMETLLDSYRVNPVTYPDLSDTDIVFLGDSIFGNYTDSMSVPGVIKGLTGARVYNLGCGGMSASERAENTLSLSAVLDTLTKKDCDLLPGDHSVTQEASRFIERENPCADLVFVLNYGLNDYFNGVPVKSADPLDPTSYSGALRRAVNTLKEAYPDAQIIVNTPNFTVYYENGELILSEDGGQLIDYVDAAIMVGTELQVDVYESYYNIPVNPDNYQEYLADGCHPNEQGRFLLGTQLIELIQNNG